MLPPAHRLRKESDIKRLFAKGKGVFDELCSIKFLKTSLQDTRIAVVVGTKVSKKAVVRNRLKRQVRAIIAQELCRLVPGFDVAMLVRKESVGVDFPDLKAHVVRVLQRAKLLKNS